MSARYVASPDAALALRDMPHATLPAGCSSTASLSVGQFLTYCIPPTACWKICPPFSSFTTERISSGVAFGLTENEFQPSAICFAREREGLTDTILALHALLLSISLPLLDLLVVLDRFLKLRLQQPSLGITRNSVIIQLNDYEEKRSKVLTCWRRVWPSLLSPPWDWRALMRPLSSFAICLVSATVSSICCCTPWSPMLFKERVCRSAMRFTLSLYVRRRFCTSVTYPTQSTKHNRQLERGNTRKQRAETHLIPESVHVESTTRGGTIAAVYVAVVVARVHGGHLVAVGVVVLLRIRIGSSGLVTAPSTTGAVVVTTSSRSTI